MLVNGPPGIRVYMVPGWREICGPQAPGDQTPCAESQQVVPGHRGGWKALLEGLKENQTHQFGGMDQDKRARKGQSPRSGGSSVVQEPPGTVCGVV